MHAMAENRIFNYDIFYICFMSSEKFFTPEGGKHETVYGLCARIVSMHYNNSLCYMLGRITRRAKEHTRKNEYMAKLSNFLKL